METNTCFTLQNLSFSYGSKQILKHINTTIPSGKIVTILGANGCGKSTLFQLLTKNLTPSLGRIYLKNAPIDSLSLSAFSRQVAIVHQNNTAPQDLTISQLVAYGRIPFTKFGRSISRDKDILLMEQAMKITGIYPFKDQTLASLSGGQRQRAWIAMALAQGTKILLLDEPTTYLDVRYQLQILKLVRALNHKYGLSIIMILHDINQAIAYSDEILALSPNGHLLAQGAPKEIITTPLLKEIYGVALKIIETQDKKLVLTQ